MNDTEFTHEELRRFVLYCRKQAMEIHALATISPALSKASLHQGARNFEFVALATEEQIIEEQRK